MQIYGRRIHIAGSASRHKDTTRLQYAHDLVGQLVRVLAAQGSTFLVNAGAEPRSDPDDPASLAIIFDWTVLSTLGDCLTRGIRPDGQEGSLVAVVSTHKSERQIPNDRRGLWEYLRNEQALLLQYVAPLWSSGGIRRARQVQLGDILICLGGGEGVEQLARLYAAAGKPVIPLDLDLGASSEDGSGGATRLWHEALSDPTLFAQFSEPEGAATLLSGITTRSGHRPISDVVNGIVILLKALTPPQVFYVRLLNPSRPDFEAVENFFRHVVDPVVAELGYNRFEMGTDVSNEPWMNKAIFDSIHHSSVVVADLTGERNNCFLELGYALGHGQRVIITAQDGTQVPFDAQMLEHFRWSPAAPADHQISDLLKHWRRTINRRPLVETRGL